MRVNEKHGECLKEKMYAKSMLSYLRVKHYEEIKRLKTENAELKEELEFQEKQNSLKYLRVI